MTPTHKPPFLIGGIADLLRWFELLIFTVSAPVLSVATVIAVVDLLTGGRLLATQPNLVFAFGVALAIGIDSQLPAAMERVRDAWEASPKRWLTLLLWVVIAAWTGTVIYTALRAFSIEQAQHVDETTALNLIGFDPALFAAQRDLLAVVLLGLSGFARVKARAWTRAEEREELQKEIELEPLRQQAEQLKARRVVNVAATARATAEALTSAPSTQIASQYVSASNLTEQPTTPSRSTSATLQPPLEHPSDAPADTDDAPERPPTGPGSPATSKPPKDKTSKSGSRRVIKLESPRKGAQKERAGGKRVAARGSAEQRVRALLEAEPGIQFADLVRRAHVSESTASKWVTVVEAERGDIAQQAVQ